MNPNRLPSLRGPFCHLSHFFRPLPCRLVFTLAALVAATPCLSAQFVWDDGGDDVSVFEESNWTANGGASGTDPPANTFNGAQDVSGDCIISGSRVDKSLLFTGVPARSYSELEHVVALPQVEIGRGARLGFATRLPAFFSSPSGRCASPNGLTCRDPGSSRQAFSWSGSAR